MRNYRRKAGIDGEFSFADISTPEAAALMSPWVFPKLLLLDLVYMLCGTLIQPLIAVYNCAIKCYNRVRGSRSRCKPVSFDRLQARVYRWALGMEHVVVENVRKMRVVSQASYEGAPQLLLQVRMCTVFSRAVGTAAMGGLGVSK